MNLLDKKLGLIILLALLLISCDDDNDALGLGEDNNPFKVFFKEIVVPSSIIKIDSIRTDLGTRILAGTYEDPEFGTVSTQGYTQMRFGSTPSIDDEATYDSVVLYLKTDYFYGTDLSSDQKILVHQLADTIDRSMEHYTFSQETFNSTPLNFDSEDKITFEIESGVIQDTVISIKLSDDFGSDLFDKAKANSDEFDDFEAFNTYIKGLALTGDDGNSSILGFDITDLETKLSVYYKQPQANDVSKNDTLNYDFFFTSTAINTLENYSYIFPNNLPTRENTALAGITEYHEEFNTDNQLLYSQAGTGEILKLDLSAFRDFKDTLNNVVINGAELIIGDVQSFSDFLPPPVSIRYYLTDDSNDFILRDGDTFFRGIQVESPGFSALRSNDPIVRTFDTDNNSYSSTITLYLQEVVDGGMDLDQILVAPSDNSRFLNRYIVDEDNVKIKIYYTVPL